MADVRQLLTVLERLVEAGNTVLVVEHNLDVVKRADWVIDLGPEGGAGGGLIVAEGTPEKIAKAKGSHTGIALAPVLAAAKAAAKPKRKAAVRRKKVVDPAAAVAAMLDTVGKASRDPGPPNITVRGAALHNLKHVDADIPRGQLTVCCGPSGSGKTSLAFDTLYAEGQRRYVESLSPYARQFVGQVPKPLFDKIEGLSPAVAIEQRSTGSTPRSTVGTLTEPRLRHAGGHAERRSDRRESPLSSDGHEASDPRTRRAEGRPDAGGAVRRAARGRLHAGADRRPNCPSRRGEEAGG
jgi:excinuclease ABC subunit A